MLAGGLRLFFESPGSARLDTHETTDGDHGRVEMRRHAVCPDVDWLISDRRYPGEPRFPGLKAIAMVEAKVERGAARPPWSGAASSPPWPSMPRSLPAPCGRIGASRTGCTGCSTSFVGKIIHWMIF